MTFKLGYLLFIYLCVNDCSAIKLTPVVQTESGPVRGFYQRNALSGNWYKSFLGIPYAKPPLGKRRFLPPVEIEKWKNVFNATKFGHKCLQSCNGRLCGKENCLFLNVYTPADNVARTQKPKAVMVWIHGGSYVEGSGNSDEYGPDYLVDKDVILVTFNYRLGVLGFLNLGHELVPGNAGLKDQNMVLKWVKKNIMRFGGDPDNITLFGQSAGAVAVDLHNIANMSKGLYARSIAMSGSVFCPWGFLTFEAAKKKGEKFIKKITKLRFNSTEEIVNFVLNTPAFTHNWIPTSSVAALEFLQSTKLVFAPSIEVVGSEKFIDGCYFDRFKSGLYHPGEHMMGFTSLESGFVSQRIANVAGPLGKIVNEIWHLVDAEKLLNLQGLADELFNAPIDLKHKYLTKYGSSKALYYYVFSYLHKTSPAKGVTHSEDLQYVFYQRTNPHLSGLERSKSRINIDLDSVTRDNYVSLIANFAKTGKPTYDGVHLRTGEKTHFGWTRSEKTGGYLDLSNVLIMKDRRPISSYALNLQKNFRRQFRRGVCVLDILQAINNSTTPLVTAI